MRVLWGLSLILGLAVLGNAQRVELRGIVADENEGCISKVEVILIDKNGNSLKTITSDAGYYHFQIATGVYTLELIPPTGFRITKFINLSVKKTKDFNIALKVDSTNAMVSEMVCPKSSDCYLVSSQKVGIRKPKIVDFQQNSKLKRKTLNIK